MYKKLPTLLYQDLMEHRQYPHHPKEHSPSENDGHARKQHNQQLPICSNKERESSTINK